MNTRRRKGEVQVDYVIAMGIFIVTFAFVVYLVTNYVSNSGASIGGIRDKGLQAQSILFGSEGLPNDWEDGNNTVRVGLKKDLYRIPIYVHSNNTKSDWPMEIFVDFDSVPDRKSITLTNSSNSRIPVQVANVSEPVSRAAIYFVTNLTQGRNLFYVYFSAQNITAKNYTGLNVTPGTSFASDCEKQINTSKIGFILCNGNGNGNGPGIRSLIHNSQGTQVAASTSIDQPYVAGDNYTGNETLVLTTLEEGPVFARYRLSSIGDNTRILMNFSFWNGTAIWRTDHVMTTTNARNKIVIRSNVVNLFDQFQNHNTSIISMPSDQMFNVTNYSVAITSSNNYVLAYYIKSNQTFEVGWNSTIAPDISTHGTPSSSNFTIWHSYQTGNLTTARDMFDELNVTVLSKETIESIGFEKLDALVDYPYDNSRSSLDMGQDHFFVRVANSTETFFSYGETQKKRDVYVESGKTLMQRNYGDIEFVTYTIGVWR